jgi:hypothetical protein
MSLLESYLDPGFFTYLILLVMTLELSVIWVYHSLTKKGIPPRQAIANLAAGGGIVLAMGLIVEGVASHWVALLLLVALLAHCVDIAFRWNAHAVD